MKTAKIIKIGNLAIVLIAFLFALILPGVLIGAEIPSIKDVVEGKASFPTIEDLTGGKVKFGDLIDKNNVDLVKEYLTAATYVNVKRGMVLRIVPQLSFEQLYPETFRKVTEKNRGKAVMDKNGVVYYEKIGTIWSGGLPFPWATNGLEVMGNYTYGRIWDSYHSFPVYLWFVNAKGKLYKSVGQEHRYLKCTCRTTVPPLGAIPGYENISIKRLSVAVSPLEIKGLGQFTVRYYNQEKDYDTGFAYLPAFKRTIRISTTTWQDNIAGSDLTYGDGDIFQEPYVDWDLNLKEKKYILLPSPVHSFPIFDKKRKINDKLQFTVGKKYPCVDWAILPVDVVEAIPKFSHVYGKRVVYSPIYPYLFSSSGLQSSDLYDRQMKLWKGIIIGNSRRVYDGTPQTEYDAFWVYDLQTGHSSLMWNHQEVNVPWNPEQDISLGALLKVGR